MKSIREIMLVIALASITTSCSDSPDPDHTRAESDRTEPAPLIVLGLDGADWGVIEELIADGEMPHIARMVEEGAYGHLLNPGPQVSPVVWTTFATGHFGRQHGILDFVYPYVEGAKRPVDSTLRREPALWNLTAAAGKTATVIGYFVSHPAEPIQGRVVTDRAFQGLDESVWPRSLAESVEGHRREAMSESAALISDFLGWQYSPDQADEPSSPRGKAAVLIKDRVDQRIVADEFLRRVTMDLLDQPGDLFISYFRIIDIVSHSLWFYHDPTDWDEPPSPEMKALLGETVSDAYRYADRIVGAILDRFADRANIVIISDHGFGSATGRFATGPENRMLTGNHRPNGVFMAHGPDILPGRVDGLTIMEIMPTLAMLLGVSIADTLPGEIALEVLDPAFVEARPPTFVENYVLDWQDTRSSTVDSESQREAMKSLQGLGYIGEGVQLAEGDNTETYDFWAAEPNLIAQSLHGEIAYYLLKNDLSAAEAVVGDLRRNKPALLVNTLARAAQKIQTLKKEVPNAEKLAPELEA
ncbi:MAG: alkaline phosphatase family protein, partial [Xanthomonadales bacterium]|nr:alkaline phosphatase family protein [Xanthomonadales bacterium]